VTVRVGEAVGTFARGMLAEQSVTLGEWYAVAPLALAAWPLEGARVTDVPGLSFEVAPGRSAWVLAARLRVPARRVPLGGGPIPGAVAPAPTLREGAGDWRVEELFPDRPALVAGLARVSAELVGDLRDFAGGPLAESAAQEGVIRSTCRMEESFDLVWSLTQMNDAFKVWRYSYERPGPQTSFLGQPWIAARRLILEIEPDWSAEVSDLAALSSPSS
jgi:hypothetical protein